MQDLFKTNATSMTIESKKMNTKITKHEKTVSLAESSQLSISKSICGSHQTTDKKRVSKKAWVARKHKKFNIQFERRAGGFSLFIGRGGFTC